MVEAHRAGPLTLNGVSHSEVEAVLRREISLEFLDVLGRQSQINHGEQHENVSLNERDNTSAGPVTAMGSARGIIEKKTIVIMSLASMLAKDEP